MPVASGSGFKEQYTYKEILLAFREELLKNQILLDELKSLIAIEKNAGYYRFDDRLKNDSNDTYGIKLVIDEIQKRQLSLRKIFNKLTNYKFARASINRFQTYCVDNNNGKYTFELEYSWNLEEDYFGMIKITNDEKFSSIIKELNSSKLSNIIQEGIRIEDNLFLGISSYVELSNGRNTINYRVDLDSLKIDLTDKIFEEMMNTTFDASLLSHEVLEVLETSAYKDYVIKFDDSEKSRDGYYKFNEVKTKEIILSNK